MTWVRCAQQSVRGMLQRACRASSPDTRGAGSLVAIPMRTIELGGVQMRWDSTDKDWINSRGSLEEVGSIHTVQGYDLNYAGVIIGPDLRVDPATGQIVVDRESYRDKKGKENTGHLRGAFGDDDLLVFIGNIYGVLLTRGMRGTYVYVCDPGLRDFGNSSAFDRSRIRRTVEHPLRRRSNE